VGGSAAINLFMGEDQRVSFGTPEREKVDPAANLAVKHKTRPEQGGFFGSVVEECIGAACPSDKFL
jgi:hypothetical protein